MLCLLKQESPCDKSFKQKKSKQKSMNDSTCFHQNTLNSQLAISTQQCLDYLDF